MIGLSVTLLCWKKRSYGAFFLLLMPLLVACSEARREVVFLGQTMGTTYSVKYLSNDESEPVVNEVGVAKLLDYLDATLSTYQYDSELNRLNRMPVGEDFAVSPMFWQLLLISNRLLISSGDGMLSSVSDGPKPHRSTKGPMVGSKAPLVCSNTR